MRFIRSLIVTTALVSLAAISSAQFGGGRGFGGVREDARIQARYDKDKDGMLNAAERRSALIDFGFDLSAPVAPRPVPAEHRLTPSQVKSYGAESLYDPAVLRTLFLSFDSPTWEDELAVFKNSDVKVPGTLSVDGRTYHDVGVSFRGQTSFRMVGAGQKRSMNIDIDFRNKEQRVLGNTRITLLNSAGDPSFLRSVMYMHIARDFYPAFKTNYMRLVINGEDWGVYVNQQPADSVFAQQNGGATGPVWKTPGSPNGQGGLQYWGDDPAPYQRVFELTHKGQKSKADDWKALINLCKVLNQTPPDKLAAALTPIMDVDNALRMLAVDNALMNTDGYYARASDYNLYMDAQGRFHFAEHDANEVMREPEGFGGGWRRRSPPTTFGGGNNPMTLDPLAGANEGDKALLYRLLAVPEYKSRYLGYIRDLNNRWLNWAHFGAVAQRYQTLIAEVVRHDDRKLYSTASFFTGLSTDGKADAGDERGGGVSLKTFVEQRHAYLVGVLGEK
jgi:hypothetical protein